MHRRYKFIATETFENTYPHAEFHFVKYIFVDIESVPLKKRQNDVKFNTEITRITEICIYGGALPLINVDISKSYRNIAGDPSYRIHR